MLLYKQQNKKGGDPMKKIIHKPYARFKGWIRENGLTYADIATFLGLNEATVSLKINGQSDFSLSEVQALKSHYKLNSNIFFTDDVA